MIHFIFAICTTMLIYLVMLTILATAMNQLWIDDEPMNKMISHTIPPTTKK